MKMRKFAIIPLLGLGLALSPVSAQEAKTIELAVEKVAEEVTLKAGNFNKVEDSVKIKPGVTGSTEEITGSSYYDSDLRYWTVGEAIRRAERIGSHTEHNRLLVRYTEVNGNRLFVDDAIRLAEACTKHSVHNQVLTVFFRNAINRITTREVVRLAKSATKHSTHNDILQRYARRKARYLTVRDCIHVAQAATKHSVHNGILVDYTRKRARTLSRYDARRLADATTDHYAYDRVMDAWADSNYYRFSANEMEDLINEFKGDDMKRKFRGLTLHAE